MAGSGKTTLAEKISEKLSIPHIHLDRFWFEAGGTHVDQHTSEAERERVRAFVRQKALAAIAADSWVSDGFYLRQAPEIAKRADVIIFLDIPLWRRLLNHAKRILRPSTRHGELTTWHEMTFFFEIIRRTRTQGPKLRQFIKEYRSKIITLKSQEEIDKYLETLV